MFDFFLYLRISYPVVVPRELSLSLVIPFEVDNSSEVLRWSWKKRTIVHAGPDKVLLRRSKNDVYLTVEDATRYSGASLSPKTKLVR